MSSAPVLFSLAFCGAVLAAGLLSRAPSAHAQSFTEVTADDLLEPVAAWGASWVDVDGDLDLDLFISNFGGPGLTTGHKLFINEEGELRQAEVAAFDGAFGATGHCWGDMDNDGDPDLVTVGHPTNQATAPPAMLYRNEGNAAFTRITEGALAPESDVRGWSCDWGDYGSDGNLDLVVAHPEGFAGEAQENHLFVGNGDGSLQAVKVSPITDGFDTYTIPSWSDYDLDGDLDLFIGSGPANGTRSPDHLYQNDGNAFSRISTAPIATDPHDGQVMNWVDIDNDLDLDLFVTNFWGESVPSAFQADALYRNEGDGTFTPVTDDPLVTDATGFSLANTWGDVDNDGDLDVFVTVGGVGTIGQDRLYLNDGTGRFEREWTTSAKPTSGATWGDYDLDGDLDLFVVQQFAPQGSSPRSELWRNDLSTGNHWIQLKLIGSISPRDALGAKVRLIATIGGEEVTQLRETSSQNTFSGQNSPWIHFGLGDAGSIVRIAVEWPSGTSEEYETLLDGSEIAVDRLLILTEDVGISTNVESETSVHDKHSRACHPERM